MKIVSKITTNSLAQRLIQDEVLTEIMALDVLAKAKTHNVPFITYLVKQRLIHPKQLALIISQDFGMPIFDLDTFDKTRIPMQLVNEKLIKQHHMMPLWQEDEKLYVAVADPTHQIALDEIKFFTGLVIQSVLVEEDKLSELIEKFLTKHQNEKFNNLNHEVLSESIVPSVEQNSTVMAGEDDAPIVRYVHKILLNAINKHSSDIHFEPYEKNFQIRFRVDGLLYVTESLPIALANRMVARLKIMAELDIAERRIPQDGRFKLTLSQTKNIDFRVSTCPTSFGEKVVLRILDASKNTLAIDQLGLTAAQKNIFCQAIKKPQGMILVTGPTGSGKTLTLYTALNMLNTVNVNICTVEDPVEIHLPGINQVNINTKAGLTFANVLRAFLRQDPDIIMVGEMRDFETAEIGIKAAQTGHLVLSTLHTNSAVETLTRMANMGIATYNLAAAVTLIIAQRLVRRLCEACKKLIKIPEKTLLAEGFLENELNDLEIYQPIGCKQCTDGYSGRIGLFELLPVTANIAEVIMQDGSTLEIVQQAKQEGMQFLREAGLAKVKTGFTSLLEINRVING